MVKNTDICSFCGRSRKEVSLLIAGMDGFICDLCVEQASIIVSEELKKKGEFKLQKSKLMRPTEIKKFLDQYVIGQEDAKAGVEAAKKAGMKCIGVGICSELADADAVIPGFENIDLSIL